MHLDRRRADALRPRRVAYDIRDRGLRGFGIRVRPSGRRIWFVHVRCDGERIWRTVGDAGAVAAAEARTRAAGPVAALRRDGAAPEDMVFEAVAGEALAHPARLRKPGTVKVNNRDYRNRILPGFRGRPVTGLTRRDVRARFVSLVAVPATTDRCLPVLSVIMRRAEVRGLRPEGSNPCRGTGMSTRLAPLIRMSKTISPRRMSSRPMQVSTAGVGIPTAKARLQHPAAASKASAIFAA